MISCWRAPYAINCAACANAFGVVFEFWKLPVSVIIPVKRRVATSSSISSISNSSSIFSNSGRRSSVADADIMST